MPVQSADPSPSAQENEAVIVPALTLYRPEVYVLRVVVAVRTTSWGTMISEGPSMTVIVGWSLLYESTTAYVVRPSEPAPMMLIVSLRVIPPPV